MPAPSRMPDWGFELTELPPSAREVPAVPRMPALPTGPTVANGGSEYDLVHQSRYSADTQKRFPVGQQAPARNAPAGGRAHGPAVQSSDQNGAVGAGAGRTGVPGGGTPGPGTT